MAIVLGAGLVSVGSPGQAQEAGASFPTKKGYHARLDTSPGLYTLTYQTPEGKILIYLPNDLHAGESIVGTMRWKPKGKDDRERTTSQAALATYHFVWGSQVQVAQETPLTWTLPSGDPLEAGRLTLADVQDRPLAQTDLPVAAPLPGPAATGASPAEPGGTIDARPPVSAFNSTSHLPRRGVIGRPLILQASIGTEALTYQILVGDRPARLLAASPRSLIVESPGIAGKTTLQIKKDNWLVAEFPFQNDRAIRRTNPWPYVLGAGLVIGIMGAVLIDKVNHDISNGLAHSFGRLPF